MRLPNSAQPYLFALFLSGIMSLLVSGIATMRAVGLVDVFVWKWLTAWAVSWAVAFPGVLVFAPLVRKLVARLVEPPGGSQP
jgi:membrane protein implicated in regulation of membrane protease activity